MDKEKVKQVVGLIVDQHSGGIKFTELLVDMISFGHFKSEEINIDEVEEIIREMEDVKILDYTMREINRAKMFVYTP